MYFEDDYKKSSNFIVYGLTYKCKYERGLNKRKKKLIKYYTIEIAKEKENVIEKTKI